MNNPTLKELMEYMDGTLDPSRRQEIESMIARSKQLKREIELFAAMKAAVRVERIAPSKKLTEEIMQEIVPQRNESLWYRLVKNSSNVFAMTVVLALIAVVLLSSSQTTSSTTHQVTTAFQTLSDSYNTATGKISASIREYTRPFDNMFGTTSGRLLVIVLFVFSVFVIIDDLFGRRILIRK